MEEEITQTMKKSNSSILILLGSASILNIFIGVSLKSLWGLVGILQFIIFYDRWGQQTP